MITNIKINSWNLDCDMEIVFSDNDALKVTYVEPLTGLAGKRIPASLS